MLSVFICEDDDIQRAKAEEIVKNYIMMKEFDMELALSSNNPDDIIHYLDQHPNVRGVYFLDVDLGHEMNGIQLGSYIREKDIDGKIIFVTTHSELLVLTFTYKVEAMDYILKDDPDEIAERMYGALKQAQKHYQADPVEKQRIKLKVGNQVRMFPLDDIIFIETSPIPHKLILHLSNSTVEFYGKISQMEAIAPTMCRVHKSYVVNTDKIQLLDRKNREVIMTNGEVCLLSTRQLKALETQL